MEGVTATIYSVEKTTVYILEYLQTDGGEMAKNRRWIITRIEDRERLFVQLFKTILVLKALSNSSIR